MAREREKFGTEELATCLSYYDLGAILRIQEFTRGSRHSPKVLIEAQRGKFLFKRRARGKDDPDRVAFTHQIQLALAAQSFPLPHLIGTRAENNSMLALEGRLYELFEFIEGGEYDRSQEATFDSGRILGLYHRLLKDFRSDYKPPEGSYHGARAIHRAIQNTAGSLPIDPATSSETVTNTIRSLDEAYTYCAEKANSFGLGTWEGQIVHGDWHPGNMLFRDAHVVAVIDYDSARLHQRAIDLANGALQFSIKGGGEDPSQWPDRLSERRFEQFMRGYDSANVISLREIETVPYLMCEAMIAEAVLPIAATGSFGRMEGFPFLQMVDRKVKWILDHLEALRAILVH